MRKMLSKVVLVLLVFVLVLSGLQFNPMDDVSVVSAKSKVSMASGKYKVTAKKALNVRTSAGTKYKKVGSLKRGKVITVNGKKGNWYRFKYKGKSRYVSGKYLKKQTTKKKTPLW